MADIGWIFNVAYLLSLLVLVTLLVMPMPSNKVRGAVTQLVQTICEHHVVRYVTLGATMYNAFYLYFVCNALLHPFYDFGLLVSPFGDIPCQMRAELFKNERDAYINCCSIFLFFILRRLADIQGKLHEARGEAKAAGAGVPMGQPVADAIPPRKTSKFD